MDEDLGVNPSTTTDDQLLRMSSAKSLDSNESSEILPPPPVDHPSPSAQDRPPVLDKEDGCKDDDTYGFSTAGLGPVPERTAQDQVDEEDPEPHPNTSSGTESSLPLQADDETTIASSTMAPLIHTPSLTASPGHLSAALDLNDTSSTSFKSKILERLTQALESTDTRNHRRSPDVVPLTKDYQTFRKTLRLMISSIKAYQKSIKQMDKARSKLFQEYAAMSENTPLFDHVGRVLDPDALQFIEQQDCVALASTLEGLGLQEESKARGAVIAATLSLASVQHLGAIHEKENREEFQEFVLGYALEWEEIVTSKLDQEIKDVRRLQQQRIHYEKKVAGLRKRHNTLASKEKAVPEALSDKLARNDDKLKTAWETHEHRSCKLCILLEEVTLYGWKDLYPLVKNSMRYEMNRNGRENLSIGRLPAILDAMKKKSFSKTLNAN